MGFCILGFRYDRKQGVDSIFMGIHHCPLKLPEGGNQSQNCNMRGANRPGEVSSKTSDKCSLPDESSILQAPLGAINQQRHLFLFRNCKYVAHFPEIVTCFRRILGLTCAAHGCSGCPGISVRHRPEYANVIYFYCLSSK